MITIEEKIYREIAQQLIREIGSLEFFNGRCEYDTEEFCSVLTATLIIYRDAGKITNVVPVWWEFHLIQADGEHQTDFGWSDLLEYLPDYY